MSEIEDLRRQVAAYQALGVSIAKAEDRARRAERAAIVAYLREMRGVVSDSYASSLGYYADRIEQGAHEEGR